MRCWRWLGLPTVRKKLDGDLHWYDLRRECAIRFAEKGVDVLKVKELLGRATIVTTQR